ncbi:hypothetical protein O5O45_12285 [Hahella aquimaris]|uniref:hypothetical protein n=1 Tax=Hahella sp. HNIBRBA332 TaxID=3015983 RepID=UPI00273BBF30|nr:hypothetical protein [Hahella sp. HNIBRBA332]WLQ16696.1 hypothetical protein O5O45_12285 [Hahella sp. HNIBRBA332]
MSLLAEVKSLVVEVNKLHPEDPKVYEYWEKLTELLSKDESSTLSLFNDLDDSDIVEDLSSVFDDVSRNLQSKDFILCIESLERRYPDLMLEHMIQAAKDALID